jgi:hypothetical protein
MEKLYFSGPRETTLRDMESWVDRKSETNQTTKIEIAEDNPEDAKWIHPVGSLIMNCNVMRNLSLYWLRRLTGNGINLSNGISFRDNVSRIQSLISQESVPKELRDTINEAWQNALSFDQLRLLLSGSVIQPNGLLPLDIPHGDEIKIVGDLDKILEANADVIKLTKEICSLLESLLKLPGINVYD